jgi:hypothetical protein
LARLAGAHLRIAQPEFEGGPAMDAAVSDLGSIGPGRAVDAPGPAPLSQIRRGAEDGLGNRIEELYWCGSNYTIYRSNRGVFVHFSDCPEEARRQRLAFTEICPELCELRFLTGEMDRNVSVMGLSIPGFRAPKDSIFDHNIAQAIMLLMEGKVRDADDIAKAALTLAVSRATSDNTIRYLCASMATAFTAIVLTGLFFAVPHGLHQDLVDQMGVAAGAGAVGAFFSIITRLESFELKPCQQSRMNYWVSVTRILMGVIAGVVLVLIVNTSLGGALVKTDGLRTLAGAAVLGFLGGFAERLVQTLAQRAAVAMGDRGGTPVQVARKAQQAVGAEPRASVPEPVAGAPEGLVPAP